MKFKFILIAFLSIFFFFENGIALEAPNPPVNFTAFVQNNNQNANSVYFKWMKNAEGTQPVMFILYVANENTKDLSKFKRSDYIQAGNLQEYSFIKSGFKSGDYSFFLTAAAIEGNSILESKNSDIVSVTITNNEKPFIRIISQPPTYASVGKEYIYQLKVITNLSDNCPLEYKLQYAPKNMKIDNSGLIKWIPEENGVFKVSVMVGTTCKINVEPAIQDFAITVGQNNQEYVKILSQPPHTAVVGQPLIYQIVAQSNIRCPILFELISDLPNEVSFDKRTGLLKWIPAKPGTYKFTVKAYLECDEKISDVQTFVINVIEGHNDQACVLITGVVEFESENQLVKEGRVNAWRIDKRTNTNITYSSPIQDGYFTLKVPEGIYLLNFDGPEFLSEWYKDALSIDKAEKLELKCDDQMKIHVFVQRKKHPKTFKVTGNVSNEQGDKPLMATVQFIPIDIDKNYRDPNQPTPNTFITKTDDKGNYSIQLPDNFIYRAYAVPMDNNFIPQYYDKVESPFEADLIELTGDISGIDFRLKLHQQHKNSFTGKVISDKEGNPLHSLVFAYLVSQQNNNTNQRFSRMTETDRSGYFRFENLIPGEYVLLSIPYDRAYTPGYYKMGDIATLKWREATRINVGENMIDIIFEIRHKNRAGLKGIIQIDGVIIDNSGIIKKSDVPTCMNTLAGAFVYVLDEFGEVSDYTFTDINGKFHLTEIADGENTLYVDHVGFKTYQQEILTDYSENIRNSGLVIVLDAEEPLSIDEPFESISDLVSYPNPAMNILNLQFSGKHGISELFIYDNIGNLVYSSSIQTSEGLNRTSIDVRNLNQGIYYLRIVGTNYTKDVKFSIIR